jgi:hypothetical protein
MRWLLAAALGCAFLVGLSMPQASVAADCTYELGFAVIRDLIPDRVGLCLENAHGTENGDVLQATSLGLLVWRKADNWTAYTNGDRTWVNGPCGLQERAEDHRFLWEIPTATGRRRRRRSGFPSVRTPSPGASTWLTAAIAACG